MSRAEGRLALRTQVSGSLSGGKGLAPGLTSPSAVPPQPPCHPPSCSLPFPLGGWGLSQHRWGVCVYMSVVTHPRPGVGVRVADPQARAVS